MAAASTVLLGLTAAAGTAKSVSDMVSGNRAMKQAQRAMSSYNRQSLVSPYEGMSVPTRGFEMERESAMATQAEAANLLSMSGERAAMGGSAQISQSTRQTMADIGSRLDQSIFNFQQMLANDRGRVQQMQEQREIQDLQGIGSQLAYGQSLRQSGTNQLISTMGSITEASMNTEWGKKKLW